MNSEQLLQDLNAKVDYLVNVFNSLPGSIGFAGDLQAKGLRPRFRRRPTKEQMREVLRKNWNKHHPHFQIEK